MNLLAEKVINWKQETVSLAGKVGVCSGIAQHIILYNHPYISSIENKVCAN